MKIRAVALIAAVLMGAAPQSYRVALPGYRFEFPRDYFTHADFKTEWWYYTGNVHSRDGRRFGFELTFFRQAADRDPGATGVWDVHDIWFAHLALSDIDRGRFLHTERWNRQGPGIAGADEAKRRVWNGNWQVQWEGGAEKLQAIEERFQLDLTLKPAKPPVIHGVNGVSQKAQGAGHGSHYFSETRLTTSGRITLDGQSYAVDGVSWMDHEFFTNALAQDQIGWDWFSLQFDDGAELMLGRMRRKDGTADPYSAGTYVDAQGHARHLKSAEFELTPGQEWKTYPIAWKIRVPSMELDLDLSTRLKDQELTGSAKPSMSYWEGAIEVRGVKQRRPIQGVGYLEMTGYAGRLPFD